MFMQRDFVLFLYLSWLHLVAQLEMQVLWDKRPVMSPEGVAKQEVTVFDLVVWLHAFDSSSNLLYIFEILYSTEVLLLILFLNVFNCNKCFIMFGPVNYVDNGFVKTMSVKPFFCSATKVDS